MDNYDSKNDAWNNFNNLISSSRIGNGKHLVKNAHISGVSIPKGTYDCKLELFQCELSDINMSDSKMSDLTIVSANINELNICDTAFKRLRLSNVNLTSSHVCNVKFLMSIGMQAFSGIDDCRFDNVTLNGGGDRGISSFANSTFSGVLKDVVLSENPEKNQGQNLDISCASLQSVFFPGVDMRRVICSSEWDRFMIDDWFKYVQPLKELVSRYVNNIKDARWEAAITIYQDLEDDEKSYGGPIDSARGSKFLDLFTDKSIKGDLRSNIVDFYREVGIDIS